MKKSWILAFKMERSAVVVLEWVLKIVKFLNIGSQWLTLELKLLGNTLNCWGGVS